MPNTECSVCALEAKPRKFAESLLRAGVGVREVAEFMTWQGEKAEPKYKISKSALDRHRTGGHFAAEDTINLNGVTDDEVMTLREYARKLFKAYQLANKNKVPSTKELIDFMLADAKLADIEARRHEAEELQQLYQGAGFSRTTAPGSRQPEAEGDKNDEPSG